MTSIASIMLRDRIQARFPASIFQPKIQFNTIVYWCIIGVLLVY